MRDLPTDLVRRTRRPGVDRTATTAVGLRSVAADVARRRRGHRDARASRIFPAALDAGTHAASANAAGARASRLARRCQDRDAEHSAGVGDTVDHRSRPARAAASASSDVVARTAAHVTSVAAPGRVPAAVVDAGQATPPRVPAVSVAPREARAHVVAPIQPMTRAEVPQIRRVRTDPCGRVLPTRANSPHPRFGSASAASRSAQPPPNVHRRGASRHRRRR